ncbi:DEKNAAC105002 [Brettanomyces naardenensis]|uniref:DEKNAAC105002 n=1 Tax=Brettanomyces naardenensis TaxID=13370 RepID=A0A448YS35_BRENA|nr:DEKNAAC105002 [Brettanomyces naardenensis]
MIKNQQQSKQVSYQDLHPSVSPQPGSAEEAAESSDFDSFNSIATPNVKIGIKPLPLTSALVQSDRTLVESLHSLGYDCVLLPVTNSRYKQNCKNYFLRYKRRYFRNASGLASETGPHDSASASDFSGYSNNNREAQLFDNIRSSSPEGLWIDNEDDDDFGANKGYDLDLLNVPHPKLDEINIITGPHISKTVGLLSSWIELDNEDRLINEFSIQVLTNEVSYAQYVGIRTLLMAPPKNLNNLQIYTDNLNTILQKFPKMQLSISLPICEDTKQNPDTGEALPMIDPFSTWDVWNSIRIQCNYNPNLSISLGSPKTNVPQTVVNRWLLEPVRFYLLSSYRFIPNSKNYPVLNKFNQLIIWKLIQRKALYPPTLLLHGVDKENSSIFKQRDSRLSSSSASLGSQGKGETSSSLKNSVVVTVDGKQVFLGDLSYLEYVRYLVNVSYKNNQLLPLENFTLNGFMSQNLSPDQISSPNSLQSPLEPLTSSLDNNTYRVFEQDHAKYDFYGRAITAALMDLSNLHRFNHLKPSDSYGTTAYNTSAVSLANNQRRASIVSDSSATKQDSGTLRILVVGPGRGPLIERLFSSLQTLNLKMECIKIMAIEKNPDVMIYLRRLNQDHWGNKVEIFNCDARYWRPTSPQNQGFNLVISELLGSFGCNELAPECLDSIAQYCDPQDSVFIPSEFSTYIGPAISPALYGKVSRLNDPSKFDRPYLPLWDEFDILSSKYAKVWTFRHSSNGLRQHKENTGHQFANKHNRRQSHTTLKCHRKGTIHGLIGYFSAVLYKNIILSTCPTGTGPVPVNLVSWLPFYLPIEQPIHLADEQELSVFIKRECQGDRVWYEWSMEAFIYLLLPQNRSDTLRNNSYTDIDMDGDESQVRVRTGVTRIHNPNGSHSYMRLC